MALRGLPRFFEPHWLKRLVLGGPTTAPDFPPLHIKPTAEPTVAGIKGDLHFSSTANALRQHNGTAWEEVGASSTTAAVTNADGLTVGGVIVPQHLEIPYAPAVAAAAQSDEAFFIANRAYQVTDIRQIHRVAGTDAGAVNLQITKDTGTNLPGAGTDLLTNNANAGFDLKGTAATVQVGTLTGTVASLQLAAGDRLAVDYAGVLTALEDVVVTVSLKRI